jgi:hypothetical protein
MVTAFGRCRGGPLGTRSPLGLPELISMYEWLSTCMLQIDKQSPGRTLVDVFADVSFAGCRNALVEYLGKYNERAEILRSKPRDLSNPPDVMYTFPGLKSEHCVQTGGHDSLPTTFDDFSIRHYRCLHKKLPDKLPDKFSESQMQCLQTLLTYEMQYLRGCDLQWVAPEGIPKPAGRFSTLAMLQDMILTVNVRAGTAGGSKDSGDESSSSVELVGPGPPQPKPRCAQPPQGGAAAPVGDDSDSEDSLCKVLCGPGPMAAESDDESDDDIVFLGSERKSRPPKMRKAMVGGPRSNMRALRCGM